MPLPNVRCPNCACSMSLDVMLVEDAPREALNAVIEAHPAGATFIKPLMRYIGLFAPAKTQMSHSRIATLIRELVPMIREAKIERKGRIWPAPIDSWRNGFEHMLMLVGTGQLRLPLKSHGYLLEVLVGFAEKAEGLAETKREEQRAGHAGAGTSSERQATTQMNGPVLLNAALPKTRMPDHVREALAQVKHKSPQERES
jgi:hypothetical protein